MRLRPEQLAGSLAQSLPPVCVISGDEPLQMKECCDLVRSQAREQGCSERMVLDVVSGFDWSALQAQNEAMSLFSERRLIDLRLGDSKPGKEGSAALLDYCSNPNPDNLLLISCAKVDKRTQQGKWFKALDQAGVVVQIWPVEAAAIPGWIQRRAGAIGLNLEPAACALLADRVEGNLLAAQQELEILALLLGDRAGNADMVAAAVADSARFDTFTLVDEALLGNSARALRMLQGLRQEGVEAVIIQWALGRELRSLCQMAESMALGQSLDAVLQSHRVWNNRRAPVSQVLKRYNARALRRLLQLNGRCERVIKGSLSGDPWQSLTWLLTGLSGIRIPISNYMP